MRRIAFDRGGFGRFRQPVNKCAEFGKTAAEVMLCCNIAENVNGPLRLAREQGYHRDASPTGARYRRVWRQCLHPTS